MSSEFRFPKIVIHEVVTEGEKRFRNSVTSPLCDFCFDERVRWSYESEDFILDLHRGAWASHDGWAACDQCSEYIEKLLWNDLIARVLRSWKELGTPIKQDAIEDAGAIVFGFSDLYTPGREAFG
jgi:hypothetical protein